MIYNLKRWWFLRGKCRHELVDGATGSRQVCGLKPAHAGPHQAGDHLGFYFSFWGTDQQIDRLCLECPFPGGCRAACLLRTG